jgi:hypothetical protein
MKHFVIIAIVALSILILNVSTSFSEETELSKIKLHKMRSSIIDGGQPLVFVGKFTTDSGKPIYNATIIIKNDQNCPDDQIIGQGITDKGGKFSVYTMPKIWNEKDNRVTFHAEFNGDEKYSASISENRMYVIYPEHAQKCEN